MPILRSLIQNFRADHGGAFIDPSLPKKTLDPSLNGKLFSNCKDSYCRQKCYTTTEIKLIVIFILQFSASMHMGKQGGWTKSWKGRGWLGGRGWEPGICRGAEERACENYWGWLKKMWNFHGCSRKTHEKFPFLLVFDLGISKRCHNFSEFSGVTACFLQNLYS